MSVRTAGASATSSAEVKPLTGTTLIAWNAALKASASTLWPSRRTTSSSPERSMTKVACAPSRSTVSCSTPEMATMLANSLTRFCSVAASRKATSLLLTV